MSKAGRGMEQLEFAEDSLDRREAGAKRLFDAAEACGADPDRCAAGRWMAHMFAGDFAAAWQESDAIRGRGGPDPHRMWSGESLKDRNVIVRCLHGYGDAIQFLRYAPQLRSLAAEVTYEVPPALYELAPYIEGVDHVITWGRLAPVAPTKWDAQIEVMELPYIFRTVVSDLPIAQNYMHLPQSRCNCVNRKLGRNHPRVGVVWAGGEWNHHRSIPFPVFSELLRQPECEFWSLQGGAAQADWQMLPPSPRLRDSADLGEGILNLACVISQLDLVITVDTLAAHLAGAMGIPAWVLLQGAADWRWMARGATSPWYPSLRLFRQHTAGDWAGLIADVRQELHTWNQLCSRPQMIA
ncbi:glycosyltransferase family 9 protein [Occallatibacter savannae]|uniref:glycosyltransferase family 9 protein n=1 Tax=Occallatibacter savannae TaxID=1002691 RepID=UPI0013A585BE|nr:glycosyltransferase family 9 protein [Occallatibacter savannae]